jgi:hypothetical protein
LALSRELFLTECPAASTHYRPLHPGKFAILAVAAGPRNRARFAEMAGQYFGTHLMCTPVPLKINPLG